MAEHRVYSKGMTRLAKFVASALLIVFTASPLLAAFPCHQAGHAKMQCGPECPMMAKGSSGQTASAPEIVPGSATPACCPKTHTPPAPLTTQAGPERPFSVAFLLSSAASMAMVQGQNETFVPVLKSVCVATRSQASLCTFLI